MKININNKLYGFVCVISISVGVALVCSVWNINFWPTDAGVYYIKAATQLPHLDSISDMHSIMDSERVRWLHGKEVFIVLSSWMQRLLHDQTTLRPLILVCIISLVFSFIFFFFLLEQLCNRPVAWIAFFILITTSWSYIYVLFVKHQPLGLMFALISFCCLYWHPPPRSSWLKWFVSGLTIALSLFSSTVSALYLPWFLIFLFFQFDVKTSWFEHASRLMLIAFGCLTVLVWINWPDVSGNLYKYWEYVKISGEVNHFFYNQLVLTQWLENPATTRAGLFWVVKYLQLVIPVVWWMYVLSVLYLVFKISSTRKFKFLGIVVCSIAPVFMAEFKQVAQYGANYYPLLFGFLVVIACALKDLMEDKFKQYKLFAVSMLVIISSVHVLYQSKLYFNDIYPSRMMTTFLSQELTDRGITDIYTYRNHRHRRTTTDQLNPDVKKTVRIHDVDSLQEQTAGWFVIPPITGDSLYNAMLSTYTDFDKDEWLNQLVERDLLKDVTVASFKSLASSKVWVHEEEILSYRAFFKGLDIDPNDLRTQTLLVRLDDIHVLKLSDSSSDWLNIGTMSTRLRFKGYIREGSSHVKMSSVAVTLRKIGHPQDQLIMYVFRKDQIEPIWIKYRQSEPLDGDSLQNQGQGTYAFIFNPPLELNKEDYNFVIYRTGANSEEDYYQIQLRK